LFYERTYPVLKSFNKFKTDYVDPDMPIGITLPKYSMKNSGKNTDIKLNGNGKCYFLINNVNF
jgi:hypothetical protein